EGSTARPFISPLADMRTVTMPPPAVPSTSSWSSSACIASILVFSSAACFIRPRKSAMVVLSGACRAQRALIWRMFLVGEPVSTSPEHALVVLADVVRPDVLGEDRLVVGGRLGRHHVAVRCGRRQLLLALAHRDDLRPGEFRQHRLHQRGGPPAAPQRAAARPGPPPAGGLSPPARDHPHPPLAGPGADLAREIADDRLRRARLKRDLEPPRLEAHQPHVTLERRLGLQVALVRRKRDQVLEPRERDCSRWRRHGLDLARHRLLALRRRRGPRRDAAQRAWRVARRLARRLDPRRRAPPLPPPPP